MEKVVENQGLSFHGECAIIRAELLGESELPENAREVKPDEQGRLLVAHSESGHHHYVDSGSVKLYETDNELIKYLQVEEASHALLKHAKPSSEERHNTQKLPGGLYRVNIQRESTPEGWRRVAD